MSGSQFRNHSMSSLDKDVNMMLAVVTLVSLALLQSTAALTKCTTKADCAADECCYHAYLSLIATRQIQKFPFNNLSGAGICRKLAKMGQVCDVFHGACGCALGMKCTVHKLNYNYLLGGEHMAGGGAAIAKKQIFGGYASATCVTDNTM